MPSNAEPVVPAGAEPVVPTDAERTVRADAERTVRADAERTVPTETERTVPTETETETETEPEPTTRAKPGRIGSTEVGSTTSAPDTAPPDTAPPDTARPEGAPPAPSDATQPVTAPTKITPPAEHTQPIASAASPAPAEAEPATPGSTRPTTVPIAVRLRLTRRRAFVLAVLVILAALTSGATIQLRRTPPAPRLAVDVARSVKIPGSLKLPWPKAGAAEMMVEGLGRLGGVNGKKAAPIGSVAKVMTAYLILKNHPLSGDDSGPVLTVKAADVEDYQSRIPSGQSLVKVAIGERISERQALEALMLPSANNIAHMLGVWHAGSAEAFVADMNEAAAALGMTGTRYTDPSGFLPSTVSTAADQVVLARAALRDEVFADIIAEPSATIPVAGKIKNYNDMLGRDGVFGIKTGSTTEAGGNLVFASRLELDGQVLTIVGAVFNQPGDGTRAQLARVNKVVHRLLTAAQAGIRSYSIIPAQPIGTLTTAWGDEVTVSAASALKVVGWPGLSVPVTFTTSVPGASARSGQTIGAAEARAGASAVRVDLRADRALPGPSLWWRLTRR